MKKKVFGLLMIISLICFFSSCQNNVDGEDAYTVWTDLSTYSEFQSSFGTTLDDEMYLRLEFTSSQWSQMSGSLTSEGRHSWTKSQIVVIKSTQGIFLNFKANQGSGCTRLYAA